MTISGAISNANTGLAAAQRRADLVSSNIANALTPGYARRDLAVSERIVGNSGAGVSVDGVIRAGDPVLSRERRAAEAFVARDQTLAAAYASLNAKLGEPDDSFSLVSQYANFEAALRALGDSPESAPQQAAALDTAKSLVTTINRLSGDAQAARKDADSAIARRVNEINNALKKIEQLNSDIARGAVGGRDVSALEDQRRLLIDDISQAIPVREVPNGQGGIDLMTDEGVFLLAGTARTLEFTPTPIITPDRIYDNGAGVLSGLSINGVNITPGGTSSQRVRNGELSALFAVRDEIAPGLQSQLDGLSRDLIERFTDIDATLPAGAPGLFTDGGAAFDPATEVGLAGRLSINAAVDPANGGAVWRLRDGLGAVAEGPAGADGFVRAMLDSLTAQRTPAAGTGLAGSLSAAQMAAGVTSSIGSARIAAETSLASTSARAASVAETELALIGVDTDVEMQKLLLIEQAFAANARVIEAAKGMMAILMEI